MIEIKNHKSQKEYTIVIKGRSICRGSQYETERRVMELAGALPNEFTVACGDNTINVKKGIFVAALTKSIADKRPKVEGRNALFGSKIGKKRFDVIKVAKGKENALHSMTVSAQWFEKAYDSRHDDNDAYKTLRNFVETATSGNVLKVDGGYIVAL